MNVLITGCCGMLGHHMIEHFLKNTDWNIVGIDKLSYASRGLDRLRSFKALENPRFKMFIWDLCSELTVGLIKELGNVNIIIHLAADTHVDNSISTPIPFVLNNVTSTLNLLEYSRKLTGLKLFLYFSTDEIYGVAEGDTLFKEWDRQNPTNPYSASKAASENICLAYANTYKTPVIITNTMNIIGERQHIEKFLPKIIHSIMNEIEIPVHCYADCKTPGTRFYIHARNVSDAILFVIKNGKIGDKYNISGEREISNLELIQIVSSIMNKEAKTKMVNFHSDRPGHDLRYGLDDSKLRSMGWKPPIDFDTSLEKTVIWTMENKEWLNW